MILYHGSNTPINVIDLTQCRPYKDFGKGFYLTTIEEQSMFAVNIAYLNAYHHGYNICGEMESKININKGFLPWKMLNLER